MMVLSLTLVQGSRFAVFITDRSVGKSVSRWNLYQVGKTTLLTAFGGYILCYLVNLPIELVFDLNQVDQDGLDTNLK